MRLSKTTEYALRILGFMINSDKSLFSAGYISEKLDMPDKYIRRIMTELSKNGFITSKQGREGGYVFTQNAENITLWEIVDAVEGIENYTKCILGFEECNEENPCVLHDIFAPVKEKMLDFLSTNTLADLKNEKIVKF